MSRQRAVIYLSALLFVFGVFVTVVSAQDESEPLACYAFTPDGEDSIYLDELPFEDCAYAIFNQMSADGLSETYGYWGDYPVYVNDVGDVYYAEDSDAAEWYFWATLEVEEQAAPPDLSDSDDFNSLSFDETMDYAFADINAFWEQVFAEYETDYFPPDSLFFDWESVDTPCGNMTADRGPFYCAGDHRMYYPMAFMMDQFERIGDFAPVVVVAHEWGHSVQAQFNLLTTQMSIEFELQADCLAGAYGSYAANESQMVGLAADDIDEAMQSLFEVGDSEDTAWFDPQAHGTSEQRQAAFLDGFENGVDRCFGTEQ
jgi:uncharacterized protein